MVPNARARVGNYIYKTYFSGQTSILLLHSIGFSHLKVFPCARHETGRRFDILRSSQRSFLYQVSKSKTNQLFFTSVSWRLSGGEDKEKAVHSQVDDFLRKKGGRVISCCKFSFISRLYWITKQKQTETFPKIHQLWNTQP